MRTEGCIGEEEQNVFFDKLLLNLSLSNKKKLYIQLYFPPDLGKVDQKKGKPVNHHKANDLYS